jgi:cell division transport system permease protein
VAAAGRLKLLALVAAGLIALATAAMVTLAAQAALAANRDVLRTLRLVGATDRFIARAFVVRFSLRALAGAAAGTALGTAAVALIPRGADGLLVSLGFSGAGWLVPLAVPPAAMLAAYVATRTAAARALRGLA